MTKSRVQRPALRLREQRKSNRSYLVWDLTTVFTKYYGGWNWNQNSEWWQGTNGIFWSSTPYSAENARNLNYNSTGINPQNNNNKGNGFSIRCVAR